MPKVRGRKKMVPGGCDYKLTIFSASLVFRERWSENGGNGDRGAPGERCVSTTNRNFEHRQGPKVRTHLVSPETAAATALAGRIADVRQIAAGSF